MPREPGKRAALRAGRAAAAQRAGGRRAGRAGSQPRIPGARARPGGVAPHVHRHAHAQPVSSYLFDFLILSS